MARCMPLHSRHIKHPKLVDAQRGFLLPQSQHRLLSSSARNLCQFLVKLRARVHNFDVCEFCPSVWRSNPLSKLQAHSHSQSPRPSKQVYRSSKKKKMSKLLITILSSSSIKMVLFISIINKGRFLFSFVGRIIFFCIF